MEESHIEHAWPSALRILTGTLTPHFAIFHKAFWSALLLPAPIESASRRTRRQDLLALDRKIEARKLAAGRESKEMKPLPQHRIFYGLH